MLDPDQLKKDLRWLHTDHGMSMETLQSLAEGPEQARKSINLFKGMLFVFNGVSAVVGLSLLHYGVRSLSAFPDTKGLLALGVGMFLLILVTKIYIRQVLAIKATEQIARKHNLL